MNWYSHRVGGLTLVEVLVVISIMALLGAIALIGFSEQRTRALVRSAAEEIQFSLEGAHADALAGKHGEAQGVKFNNDSYIRFSGDDYEAANGTNVSFSLPAEVLVSTTLGGDEAIVFDRLTGETGGTATVTVALRNDMATFRQIVIGPRGDITFVQP